jgi:hypothetical protein
VSIALDLKEKQFSTKYNLVPIVGDSSWDLFQPTQTCFGLKIVISVGPTHREIK